MKKQTNEKKQVLEVLKKIIERENLPQLDKIKEEARRQLEKEDNKRKKK